MSPGNPLPETTPEEFQEQMANTRDRIGEQAQALGEKVMQMAQDASTAVAGAIQSGKDVAQDVQNVVQNAAADGAAYVKRAIDISGYIRRQPWLWVSGAVAVGFVCGRWTRR